MGSWPDSIAVEIPTSLASELLAYMVDAPASAPMKAWLLELTDEVRVAKAQVPLFGEARGPEVGDDWMPIR